MSANVWINCIFELTVKKRYYYKYICVNKFGEAIKTDKLVKFSFKESIRLLIDLITIFYHITDGIRRRSMSTKPSMVIFGGDSDTSTISSCIFKKKITYC